MNFLSTVGNVSKGLVISGAVLGVGGLATLNIYSRFITAQPNEWLLVIKDGELKQAGIGISTFRGVNDVVVRFPSLLNKVTFTAQQVSKEMQGVEVNGFLIWAIKRDGDGPLKAYRHIKNLENVQSDSEINQHIKSMAESIVRHQIANLGINEVISQRKKVRDGIVGEMQEILSGWGIWLETVEITEVRILSASLFNDLQQKFRSASREEAQQIQIESNHKVTGLRNEREMTMKLTKQKQDQQFGKEREGIKREDLAEQNKTSLMQSKFEVERRAAKQQQEQQLAKDREVIKRETLAEQNKTSLMQCTFEMEVQTEKQKVKESQIAHSLHIQKLENEYEFQKLEQQFATDNKMSDNSMKKQILQTVENVYRSMRCESMKIVNFGSDQSLEYGIGKMALAMKEVGKNLDS
eukprot:CAMPEP_0202712718 /NCGR_PEP_ID=MMETSP1385-20130828/44470_1 /ASSEMBLY_ACC=CAM_ASM_000861 /TAXON_ID=933848 /ORGANISM="Elphidium margaritaceum" /LENGTH=408 /DNA_ID=CAMNT_0049372829 /DNA_START=34 /DNA_END=1260 /DNA_ORIENTATION=+